MNVVIDGVEYVPKKELNEEAETEHLGIKVGDIVIITDSKRACEWWTDFFRECYLDYDSMVRFAYSEEPEEDVKAVVNHIYYHARTARTIYVVKVIGSGKVYLMDGGIQKYEV